MHGDNPGAQHAPADISWTASEFIAHTKGMGWYGALALGTAVAMAVVYFWTRDTISVGAVFIMALLLATMAGRKPRVLHYQVTENGFAMGNRFYSYADFKSFSVVEEGAFSSIVFLPLKRFMPTITIYYDPKDEERIVSVLSQYLPMDKYARDAIERLSRRIRF